MYPHLHWSFNMGQQQWLPNAFAWFTVGLLPMFFYKPAPLAAVCSLWGTLTYTIPLAVLPAEETMSVY